MVLAATLTHLAPTASRLPVSRPRLPAAQALLPWLSQIDANRWYSNFGPLLRGFEDRLAGRFAGPTRVVTMVNATQGLSLTLRALGAGEGGLCAMPAWTFVASAHAVTEAGLTPWFLDVDPETWMLDPERVKAELRRAPGAVEAVLLVAPFGQMPDVDAWLAFQAETGVPVLIDAAAAFDQARDARLPLVVSLHATKALGIGEGGFLATEDGALADRVRELTTYGFRGDRNARGPATNAKLSEYSAAVGHAALDAWEADRRSFLRVGQRMRLSLALEPGILFQRGWSLQWVTSVCVVQLPGPWAAPAAEALETLGIETRAWWGRGCHASDAFRDCPRGDLSHTEDLARSSLGLPFASDMDDHDVNRVCGGLRRIVTCL